MNEWTFTFHIETGTWQECQNPAFLGKDISEASFVPIVSLRNERTGEEWEKAWCEKHHAYEEIESYKADQVITKNGCVLEGMAVPVKKYVTQSYYRYYDEASSFTVRWRVRNNPSEKMVYLEHDTMEIHFAWEKDDKTGEFIAVPSLGTFNKYTI